MWTLRGLIEHCNGNLTCGYSDGNWYPARPMDCWTPIDRIKRAWAVFTGKADCFMWPGGQ